MTSKRGLESLSRFFGLLFLPASSAGLLRSRSRSTFRVVNATA